MCGRCGRYIGALAPTRYKPAPYAVALDKIGADDELAALVGFEWHMVQRLRDGNFVLRHPERDGVCVSMREWLRDADDDDDGDEPEEDDAEDTGA